MYDILPFLRLTGGTPEEKIKEIADYLNQLKEALEFTLTNISADNLSPELTRKLDAISTAIGQIKTEREEEISQISRKISKEVI